MLAMRQRIKAAHKMTWKGSRESNIGNATIHGYRLAQLASTVKGRAGGLRQKRGFVIALKRPPRIYKFRQTHPLTAGRSAKEAVDPRPSRSPAHRRRYGFGAALTDSSAGILSPKAPTATLTHRAITGTLEGPGDCRGESHRPPF